jgi:hypothetical protein
VRLALLLVAGCGRVAFDPVAGDGASWQLVQTAASPAAGAGAEPVNMAASGGGHLLVVAVQRELGSAVTSITDDGGNVYSAVPVTSSSFTALEIWFAVDSRPGATSLVANGGTVHATVVWEFSGIDTVAPLHTTSQVSDQAASTSPVGPSIETIVPGELVLTAILMQANSLGLQSGSPFTNDRDANHNGWAHLTSNAAPPGTYQASWLQDVPAVYHSSAVAFFPAALE